MNMIQNVWFDDAATSAMGEAFDNACKSLRNFGSAVPAIIADLIIAAAKNGERDPARLYEQAVIIFAIEDTSMPLVSVGRDPAVPTNVLATHNESGRRTVRAARELFA
jgi:hypothetical protein